MSYVAQGVIDDLCHFREVGDGTFAPRLSTYNLILLIQPYRSIDFNTITTNERIEHHPMPIPKERFQTIADENIRPGTNAERIMTFLLENEAYAFRMTEIAEGADIPQGSVGPTLRRMEEDGLVEHRANYWRVSDSYLASKTGLSMANAVAADHDDGKEFDKDAWDAVAEESSGE